MTIDPDLQYNIKFISKDGQNQFVGQVIAWQGYMAQVKWPRRTITTLTKGFDTKEVIKEPEIAWVNPENEGFELIAKDNIYNKAIISVKNGIKPGEAKTVFETKDDKIIIVRSKNIEEINLRFKFNSGIKPLRLARWGKDLSRQSGGGKWIFVTFQEYMTWVARNNNK